MAKYTYKEIKEIINNTPKAIKGINIGAMKKQCYSGYFHKSTANWSYQVYYVESCEEITPVVVVFGQIQ